MVLKRDGVYQIVLAHGMANINIYVCNCLQSPMNNGTDFYNYKGFFSTFLMAASDSNYNIIWTNVYY